MIPGYRFFRCDSCDHEWKEKSRDANSPSGDSCWKCDEWVYGPYRREYHAEWKTDESGNLICH